MAEMTWGESKFGAPRGDYQARFKGVYLMPETDKDGKPRKPMVGRDGIPMERGLEWQWEIIEGDCTGQIVSRITAQNPTSQNSCGTLLAGVLGRQPAKGESNDPNKHIDQVYTVLVRPSKGDTNKTNVADVSPARSHASGPPAKAPAGPATGQTAPPPASRPKPPPPRKRPDPAAHWGQDTELSVWDGTEEKRMKVSQIQAYITGGLDPETILVREHEDQEWRTAKVACIEVPF